MAGGQGDFIIRSNGTSHIVYIPKEYWGLKNGMRYRLVVWPISAPSNYIPYSCDITINPNAKNRCYVVIPTCFGFTVGDEVTVWIGNEYDFDNEALPHGRGRTQKEREEDLKRAESLLLGYPGE